MRPVLGYNVSTGFKVPGRWWAAGYHTGIDYAAPYGTPVYSQTAGIVEHVGWGGWGSAYGAHVIIRYGTKKIGYMHLSSTTVRKWQPVRAGTMLGRVGTTGNSTGPHLHQEARRYPYRYNHFVEDPQFIGGGTRKPKPKVYLSKLHYGQRNSRSVKKLQRRLNKKFPNRKIPVTGYYGKQTDFLVRLHQKKLGWKPDPKGKSFVGRKQARKLGLKRIVG